MVVLDTLWEYQEIDLLMDQHIQEKKNSDLRHQLLKIRNYLMKQEELLITMDGEATQKSKQLAKLLQEYNTIEERILGLIEKLKKEELETLNELEDLAKEGLHLRDRIRRKEEELNRLKKELGGFEGKMDDIRRKVASAKREYTTKKMDYDKEVAGINQKLNQLREQRDKIGDTIDKDLMVRYNNIKASKTPVLAHLIGNQCDGCYMSLASLVVQRVKDAKRIVECENCGRILFDRELISS